MDTEVITSRQNPRVKQLIALSERKERVRSGLHRIEGERLVLDALESGAHFHEVFLSQRRTELAERFSGLPLTMLDDRLFDQLSDTVRPQGIAAVVETPKAAMEIPSDGLVVALDGVQDPGNLGAILRSCDAFGVKELLLSPGCADAYGPKALRAAMGSSYHLPLVQEVTLTDAIERFRMADYITVCGHLSGEETLPKLNGKALLVIGNEGNGVSEPVCAACYRYRLPMKGKAESLNAAVAAAILVYALSERI